MSSYEREKKQISQHYTVVEKALTTRKTLVLKYYLALKNNKAKVN